jgi:glycosyltransferase involved in cell wall biosynthesis
VAKVRALGDALVERGHHVEVWCTDFGAGRSRVRSGLSIVDGLPVRYFRRWASYRWSPVVPQAELAARRSTVDVAHLFGMRDGLTWFVGRGLRAAGVPYVLEPLGMYQPQIRSTMKKRVFDAMFNRAFVAGAAGLIATSPREQATLPSEVRVWERPNPVAEPAEADGLFVPPSLDLPPGARLVGWLGRISRSKGLEILVDALKDLPGTVLALAGPDDRDGALQILEAAIERVGARDRVHLLGPLYGAEKAAFLRALDVFALPSRTENFGNAAVEAALCGVSVVVSDQCGVAPLLVRHGVAVAVPLDPRLLSGAISELLSRPLDGDRAGLLADVSPAGVAAQQEAIYLQALHGTSSSMRAE